MKVLQTVLSDVSFGFRVRLDQGFKDPSLFPYHSTNRLRSPDEIMIGTLTLAIKIPIDRDRDDIFDISNLRFYLEWQASSPSGSRLGSLQ